MGGPASQAREPHEMLPAEIYIPLVDSLFKDSRTLISGSVFATVAIFTTYWKTDEIVLLYCALATVFIAGLRVMTMHQYLRARSTVTNTEIAKRWERRYVAGATASVALLGFWCYAAFAWTSDPFAHLVSFSTTIGYAMGISGRNFGNTRFVIVQIICAWAPMTAALLLYGNLYYWIFAGLLVPFFLAIKFIAERFQHTLLNALIASRDMSLLAKRFDTALNNMPHGLCMFDANHRIVVANHKLNQQLGLRADYELKGSSLRSLAQGVV
ncbi:MAG TPA: diguanylate cyclase, partial [Xanthobacteraceae bacterium]|nr:diguanylate cyclase [Xanthobacteraceae bacterium]